MDFVGTLSWTTIIDIQNEELLSKTEFNGTFPKIKDYNFTNDKETP